MFRERFSKRLRELRSSRGLSQEQLAKLVKTSTNAIGMYETGKRMPREEILERLHDYFDVSLDYLFGFSDDPSPNKNKEIEVFKIVNNKQKEELVKIDERVLFKKGDFALKVTDEISDELSPFYFINDVLIFEDRSYMENAISLINIDEEFLIAKLNRKNNCYTAELLNPVMETRKAQKNDLTLIGVLAGMIRTIRK